MMHKGWYWLGGAIGLCVACSGSEFTQGDGDAGPASGSGGSSGTSSVVTTGPGGSATGGSGDGTTSVTSTSVGTTSAGGAAGSTGGPGGAGGRATGTGGSAGTGGRGGSASTGGAAGTGTGGAGTGGTGTGGVRDGGSAGAPDSSTDPCPALRADVDAKLIAAQKCDPTQVQCQDIMDGICCKVPVFSLNSHEAQAYQAALDKFNAAQCKGVCIIACKTGTTYCAANPDTGGNCAFGGPPPPP